MTEVDESIYKVRSSNKKWSKENIIFLILLIVLSINYHKSHLQMG